MPEATEYDQSPSRQDIEPIEVDDDSAEDAPLHDRLLGLLRILLPLSALLLVALGAWHELRRLDPKAVHQAFQSIAPLTTLGLVAAGLAATAIMALYDTLLRRWLVLPLDLAQALRFGWLAGVMNNVVGFAGMTGSGLRYLAYGNAGVPVRKALACAGLVMLAMPTGLSVLAWEVLVLHRDLLGSTGLPFSLAISVLAAVGLYAPAFLLVAGRGPLHRRFLADTPTLGGGHRLGLVAASLLDWLAAALVLWACLRVAGVPVSPGLALASFVLGQTLGWVSMVPGGLGVFEGAMLALLSPEAGSPSALLAGLLLFRVVYYFVPFLLAARLLPGLQLLPEGGRAEALIQRFHAHPLLGVGRVPLYFLGRIGRRVLAYGTFVAGALLLLSAAFPAAAERLALLDRHLPWILLEGSHFSSVLAGVLLLGLARGIAAGMRGAYQVAQPVLLTGALLALLKGVAVEEAALLLTLSALLRANRSDFHRRGYPLASPRSLRWLLAVLATLGAIALLGALLYGPGELAAGFGTLAPGPHSARFAHALLALLLGLLALLGWSWYAVPPPELSLPDRDALERARRFYAEVACTPYSFLSLMGDKYLLHRVDGRSLIQYGTIRQHLVALGDPACAPSNLPAAIHGFRRLADDYDRVPVFYQVREGHLHHYHEAGFRLLKLGESAHVDLTAFTLKGKPGAKYRAALNRADRDGLAFEMLLQPLDEATWQQLRAVSDAWLGERGMGEIGFSLGSFNGDFLAWFPIAVAKQDGRIIAFANVVDDFGHGASCSIDLMRYLPDAPHGTMDFLFVNLLLHGQAAGFRWFDLGMAPLSGVGRSPWSPRDERLLKLVYELGNRFYNYQGLRSYKEKFRPAWRGVYLAYPRGHALAPILLDVTALIAGGYRRVLRR